MGMKLIAGDKILAVNDVIVPQVPSTNYGAMNSFLEEVTKELSQGGDVITLTVGRKQGPVKVTLTKNSVGLKSSKRFQGNLETHLQLEATLQKRINNILQMEDLTKMANKLDKLCGEVVRSYLRLKFSLYQSVTSL